MTEKPITVIIVNYNGHGMFIRNIERLMATQDPDLYHLLVIDNGSKDNSYGYLFGKGACSMAETFNLKHAPKLENPMSIGIKYESVTWDGEGDNLKVTPCEKIKEVKAERIINTDRYTVVGLDKNYGYETGVNVGMIVSHPTDVVLMGSDVYLCEEAFEWLKRTAELHHRIGIVSSKQMRYYGGRNFVTSGGQQDRKPLHISGWDDEDGLHQNFQINPWVNFSLVYVKRDCIRDVGMMDMSFHIYCGDNDYCRRAREKNWASVYCPKSRCYHHVSSTVGAVRRQVGEKQWHAWMAEEQRYFNMKYHKRKVPSVEIPGHVFEPLTRR